MGMLIAGVLLWSLVHLMKSVTPGARGAIIAKTGDGPHKGLVTLGLLTALALMIFGWRSAVPEHVYDPPSWGRHLNMLLMLVSIYLFATAQGKSRIRQWLRHPMLTAVVLWAIGHLLANGDLRSVILFGGIGLWALISIVTVSRNEGAWAKPEEIAGAGRELFSIVAAIVVYALLLWAHQWYTGMPLIAG